MTETVSLSQLSGALLKTGDRVRSATHPNLVRSLQSSALRLAQRLSPAGKPPRRKVALKRSWEKTLGSFAVGSRAPHGAIIDGGRRFSSKAGKMLGSDQARRGIGRPLVDRLGKRMVLKVVDNTVGRELRK